MRTKPGYDAGGRTARYEGDIPAAPLVSLLSAFDGSGHLAITIDPAEGQRYQGIVPLDGQSLAECVHADGRRRCRAVILHGFTLALPTVN